MRTESGEALRIANPRYGKVPLCATAAGLPATSNHTPPNASGPARGVRNSGGCPFNHWATFSRTKRWPVAPLGSVARMVRVTPLSLRICCVTPALLQTEPMVPAHST